MRGVIFIAAAVIVLLIGVGCCTLPIAVATVGSSENAIYCLTIEANSQPITYSFDDKIDCSDFVSVLHATAAFAILGCISTGVSAILVTLHLAKVLPQRWPLYIGGVASIAFSIGAFALILHAVTGTFCGNETLNSYLHVSGGFACMIAASIVAIAAAVTIVRKSLTTYALPLLVLSFVLCVGCCLIQPISGTQSNNVTVDVTLFNIKAYIVFSTMKIGEISCGPQRSTYSAIAAFIILSCVAAGVMVVSEIVCMFKSVKSRLVPSIGALSTALFSGISASLQVYGFVTPFCDSEALKESAHLAGGFVCSVLVFVLSVAILVLTRRAGSTSSNDYSYVADETEAQQYDQKI